MPNHSDNTSKTYCISNAPMNAIQKAAVKLMQNDLRFIFTILLNERIATPSYYIALIPYMGLIVDGIEDWINAYNNSSKHKLDLPTFNQKEQLYYVEMRNSIKLFDKGFLELNMTLQKNYDNSDKYFSSLCKPFAKHLRIYDIYGVLNCNSIPCDNTILNQIVTPFFSFNNADGESLKEIATIGGKYVAYFNAIEPYEINSHFVFEPKDYGGLIKSPFGNKYNYRFLLFTILCQINFIIYAVDKFIIDEPSTKLRFAYILYYYLHKILPEINDNLKTSFNMSVKYYSDSFRNAMAHYKLGVVLEEKDIVDNDPMFGLTHKFFCEDYCTVKSNIISELDTLGKQIKDVIKLR